ncbi:S-4TM family putative pore-forming effector [Kribbella sp. NPDC050820]|uniref:S-4TM family putative pore-forming effector n=1 Tax=Kribbella sp. NPDC050820 TaxID=3155408 RepID=UPI00340E5D87
MTNRSAPRPVPAGESARIKQRQNEEEHLRRLLAYSRHYQIAHRWRRARALGTVGLASVGPILALAIPASSEVVAAVSAGWLVLGRTLLTWLEQRSTLDAVRTQELFDTSLFHLPWNTPLVGRPPAPEDQAAAARHIKDDTKYRDWYSIELGNTPWPADVLLCQRQSMVWSRRDHHAYGTTVLITGTSWFLVGLAVALVGNLTLADYLIKIFLPSAPAFLDTLDIARQHWTHSAARRQIEERIHDLWQAYLHRSSSLRAADCREVQDSAYLLRRDGPRVPNLFYRLRRSTSEATTKSGTAAIRNTSP